jgi:hypoxanthine phosphoribosyltransferase
MSGESRVLYSEHDIQKRISELSERIAIDYQDKELILLGILKGSFIFLADLLRELHKKGLTGIEVDFMKVSSYKDTTEHSGISEIVYSITLDIRGKDVLVVEDIVDTGKTMKEVLAFLSTKNPASVNIVTLLDKPARREVELEAQYVGFTLHGSPWVEGYGLDSGEIGRGRSDIVEKS